MYDEDTITYLLQALTNLANQSLNLKLFNDAVGSETTRVMNIYSKIIGTDLEGPNDKEIWDKANKVLKNCNKVEKDILKYSGLIQDLLTEVSKS
jgi:hypothetical protein